MKYIKAGYYHTVKSYSKETGISEQTVRKYLKAGKVGGALEIDSGVWIIPSQAVIEVINVTLTGRRIGTTIDNEGQ